jgi:RNA polymerase sigma-70 factor (ECF subfamily)
VCLSWWVVSTDDPTFEGLVRREYAGLLRTASVITGDAEAARDVVQEAVARLFVAWPRVRGYDLPGAWLRRVTIRLAARFRQREGRRRLAEVLAMENVHPQPPEPSGLLDMLDGLSPMQRALVVLRYVDDLTVGEAARVVRCRESTARVHLHRARARLASLVERELSDER